MADVDLAAGRAAFIQYADRYRNASTNEIANATADVAPKAIAEAYLGRPVPEETSAFADLQDAMKEAIHG